MTPPPNDDYSARINRVIDYIEANIDRSLTLDELARVAAFSPFHFHRIFHAMVGETLSRFIARLRLERAASKVASTPSRSITEIALECGFSSSTSFAHAFHKRFGMTATEFRAAGCSASTTNSKLEQSMSKPGQAINVAAPYLDPATHNMHWRIEMTTTNNAKIDAAVEVKELPTCSAAYIRHIGPYMGDSELFGRLFGQLMAWAGPRGLMGEGTKVFTLYEDDPSITDQEKLRMSVCISVPDDTKVEGEIGKRVIAGGKYAVGHFELLRPDQYSDAWTSIYSGWLPGSGYQPDDGPPLEFYLSDPNEDPEGRITVEIAVPVKPM